MADNTELNAGSGGDTIATDEIASVKYQRVKLIHGADGVNDGDVATANPLPVDQREVVGTAIDVNTGNASAGTQRVVLASDQPVVSVDDNGGSLTVDGTVTVTHPALGGGVEAGAQRVTIANDSTGVLSVDDNGGSLTVDGTVTVTHPQLGGGTEAGAQRVTIANDSTGVLSVDDGGGTLTVDGTVTVTHPQLGGGTEAGAQRVTIANDSTGVLSVDDNGGSLTVDGTVTSDAGTGFPSVQTEDAASSGGETGTLALGYRQDADTSPVTADGDFHGLIFDNAGNLKVNIKAGSASGTEFNEDAAASGGEAGPMVLGVRRDADTTPVSADGDFHTMVFDDSGNLKVNVKAGSASGTEFNEDAAASGGEAGPMVLGVRRDADTTPVSADGDFHTLLFDATGNLKVNVKAGAAGGVTHTDDAAFTPGTDDVVPAAGIYRSTRDLVDDNDAGALAMTQRRGLLAVLEKSDGTEIASGGGTEADALRVTLANDSTGLVSVDDGGGTLTVDGTVTVTHPQLGGGTEAGAQRVTIANDSTGVISVDDGGGALTVDGTVTVTHPALGGGVESGAQRVTIANDSTGVLSVDDNGGSLTIDGTVTADAGTGFPSVQTEDAASSGGETGPMVLGVRRDADTTPVSADGDFHTLLFDATGNLKVNVKAGAAGGVTHTDDAAFTPGTDDVVPAAGIYRSARDLVDDNDAGALAMTQRRGLLAVLEKSDGTEIASGGGTEADALRVTLANDSTGVVSVDDGGGTLTVDGTVTVTHPALGGGTEAGAQRVTIANDSTGVLSVDDNGGSLTIDGTVTADAGTGTRDVQGNVAHDAADSGNPVGIGFNAAEYEADPPIVSADGDRVRGIATPQGIQWVLGGHPNIITREYRATTAQTNDAIIDTVAANSHVVITQITVTVDADTSVSPKVRIGFGTTTVPTEPADGASTTGVVVSHPAIPAGGGLVMGSGGAAIAVGGSDEELRITSEAPTGGQINVVVSYYVSAL